MSATIAVNYRVGFAEGTAVNPENLLEQSLYTTVQIQIETPAGWITGTGFFFFHDSDRGCLPLLVTNRHVFQNGSALKFFIHLHDGQKKPIGKFVQIHLTDLPSLVINHPNSDVDLAALPCAGILDFLIKKGDHPFVVYYDSKQLASESLLKELSPGEDVMIVGYPNGLWDEVNNFPIFRRGSFASHPAVGFCGKPEFLIDAACIPGSSGSPVLLAQVGSYLDKKMQKITFGARSAVLGVLSSGPKMDRPVIHQSTGCEMDAKIEMLIHLGYVVAAREIETLAQEAHSVLASKATASSASSASRILPSSFNS